jgi:hypothetical protein
MNSQNKMPINLKRPDPDQQAKATFELDANEDLGKMAIYCRHHPDEKVRYYCRECAIPLCPECVSAHARHDFIPADNKAAIEIRYILRNEKSKIMETT